MVVWPLSGDALEPMEKNPKSMDAADASATAKEGASSAVRPAKRASGRAHRTSSSNSNKAGSSSGSGKGKPDKKQVNRVRETRIERMMSKAELARRAGLSVLTIDRVEKGLGCRMDTKRKILEALGLGLVDRVRVFGEEE
jgi:DNA-binding XRE family transcriptional regulator